MERPGALLEFGALKAHIERLKIDFRKDDYYTRDDHFVLTRYILAPIDAYLLFSVKDTDTKTFTGFEFVDWLCELTHIPTDDQSANDKITELAEFIRNLLYNRAYRFFDSDYPSVYDFFKAMQPKKMLWEGTIEQFRKRGRPLKVGLWDDELAELARTINASEKKLIRLTNEEISFYDRGREESFGWDPADDDLSEKIRSIARTFRVMQRADVTIDFLKSLVVALANFALKGEVQVKPSLVEGAGYGLFADRDYDRGDMITEYGGMVSIGNSSRGLPKNQQSEYTMELQKTVKIGNQEESYFIDGERSFMIEQAGRWVITATETEPNTKYAEKNIAVNLRAKQFIFSGDEIVAHYGEQAERFISCEVCGEAAEFRDPTHGTALCGEECQKTLYLE